MGRKWARRPKMALNEFCDAIEQAMALKNLDHMDMKVFCRLYRHKGSFLYTLLQLTKTRPDQKTCDRARFYFSVNYSSIMEELQRRKSRRQAADELASAHNSTPAEDAPGDSPSKEPVDVCTDIIKEEYVISEYISPKDDSEELAECCEELILYQLQALHANVQQIFSQKYTDSSSERTQHLTALDCMLQEFIQFLSNIRLNLPCNRNSSIAEPTDARADDAEQFEFFRAQREAQQQDSILRRSNRRRSVIARFH